ncbi:MAG: hypothetical protein Q4C38_04570 [bacterium]|nr:hypothetical protein [bacterium]
MKIIKKGTKTPPDKQIYVIKCRTCGCKFTYMEENVRSNYCEEYLWCPQCSYGITVPFFKKKYKGDDK